jgi:translation initiation factor 1 (eIF-1/SUI1)
MNPFEDENNNNKTNKITGIKITLNKMGNKKVTEIEGWIDLTKEEFTEIKKKLNTGGCFTNNIIKLQGNHVEFIKNKLLEKGVNEEIITIVE